MVATHPQPIDTAPLDKNVLLWWTPKTPNPHAECWVIGAVSSHDPGKWWNGQRAQLEELAHITHWRPLPAGPTRRGGH
jgi:hypothetical protein